MWRSPLPLRLVSSDIHLLPPFPRPLLTFQETFGLQLETLRARHDLVMDQKKKLVYHRIEFLAKHHELLLSQLAALHPLKIELKKAQVEILREFGLERHHLKMEQLKRSLQDRQKLKRAEYLELENRMKEKKEQKLAGPSFSLFLSLLLFPHRSHVQIVPLRPFPPALSSQLIVDVGRGEGEFRR